MYTYGVLESTPKSPNGRALLPYRRGEISDEELETFRPTPLPCHHPASSTHRSSPDLGKVSPPSTFSSSLLLSSLELSDTSMYEPGIRALLGTAPHVCYPPLLP